MPIEQSKPLLRRVGEQLRSVLGTRSFYILNTYGPYLGAGVHVTGIAPDATWFEVSMRLRPWNKNYFGTHFGGSLYSMCDPFYALILTECLGPDYVVWDKEASIRFKRPGRGIVRARFEVPKARIDEIRRIADAEGRTLATFVVEVLDEFGEVVAEVEKVESIRRKSPT